MTTSDDMDWLEQTVDEEPTQHPPDARESQARSRPYLLVLHGENRGDRILLKEGALTIGRSQEADVPIQDKRASRIHCTFHTSGFKVYVEDNNSHNGTHLNGNRIDTRTKLESDSQIRVGHTVFKLTYKHRAEVELEDEIFEAATTDPLTSISNRRSFEEQALPILAHACRHGNYVCLLMLDVDHFKQVNDQHGHAAGDLILQELAAILGRNKRTEDLLCRYGGEEFCMLLPSTDLKQGIQFCERLRCAVEGYKFVYDDKTIPVTVSIGISEHSVTDDLNATQARADKALYEAKSGGRNRVCAG